MPTINKIFNGVMDSDSGQDFILPPNHKYALNGRFYGTQQGFRFQNIPGNVLIQNENLPEGENECIGSFYDQLKQRIIWFNWNSNNKHGIYIYNVKTDIVTPLLISFVNSVADIFNFDRDYPVASINILYTTEEDGDIIHWTARNNRPMKLNIKDALDNVYGTAWVTDFLTVARQVSIPPIQPSYEDDALVEINNLRSTLYQFRYRWQYKDNTISTWSSYSKIPSPKNPDDLASDVDPTKNNNILLSIPDSGNTDVVKVQVAARVLIAPDVFSDDFLIKVLDKVVDNIGDNSPVNYYFYNDSSYPFTDLAESRLLFDYVPDLANTQELLNGNVIIYGGITLGYDKDVVLDVESNISLFYNDAAPGLVIEVIRNTEVEGGITAFVYYELVFSGTPQADDEINIQTELYQEGEIIINNYPYTVILGDTIIDIINYYAATIPGYDAFPPDTITSPTFLINESIEDYYVSATIDYGPISPDVFDISIACWRPKSRYAFGIVYFDEFGKTNGVLTESVMNIITEEIDTTGDAQPQISLITFDVNHQPPIWAKYFSWVRTENLTAKSSFYFVSSGTNKDVSTGFAYINITAFNNNTNNYPAYDFTKGDRIRLIGKYTGALNVLDVPIIDLVTDEKIQNSAVTLTGQWIKVPYDAGYMVNFGVAGNEKWYCEQYTPVLNSDDSQLVFYEFGESYNVLNWGTETRYHEGNAQNQTAVDPAIFKFGRGDYYIRQRVQPVTDNLQTVANIWIIDESVSDKYLSKITNIGRPFLIDDYAKKTFYSTQSRWSLDYQQNTNINQTNRFFPANFDEIDRAKGDIQMFKVWGRILVVFQNRAVGKYGIYARFIQNNSGESQLVTTNDIITTNNIDYAKGDYGVGDQYTCVVAGANQFYFVDPVRGYQVRLAQDGLTPISELYKGQFYIRSLLTPYNKTFLRNNGATAKILGVYNFFDEEYYCILQGGINGETTINNYTFSFNEKRNGYSSFYNIYPEWMVSAEDVLYAWKDGQMYSHNSNTYCNFFGKQYDCSITLVFTNPLLEKKTWLSLTEVANDLFECPQIETQTTSYGTTVQQSNLIEQDFERLENQYHAAFLRDINSLGGIIDGDSLKGEYITITFQKTNAAMLVYLSEISVKFVDSPLTNR